MTPKTVAPRGAFQAKMALRGKAGKGAQRAGFLGGVRSARPKVTEMLVPRYFIHTGCVDDSPALSGHMPH